MMPTRMGKVLVLRFCGVPLALAAFGLGAARLVVMDTLFFGEGCVESRDKRAGSEARPAGWTSHLCVRARESCREVW